MKGEIIGIKHCQKDNVNIHNFDQIKVLRDNFFMEGHLTVHLKE